MANRRRCPSSRVSTAARFARCASLRRRLPKNGKAYQLAIRDRYGDLADEFLRLYPSAKLEESILATTRDALYGWTAERLVRKQTELGRDSFLYFFDHGYPAAEKAELHAFHASGVAVCVRHGSANAAAVAEGAVQRRSETKLSDAMLDYWASFIRSAEPSANGQRAMAGVWIDTRVHDVSPASRAQRRISCPGMYELNEQVRAGDERAVRRRGTGTWESSRRHCRRPRSVVDDRRVHARVSADARQVSRSRGQVASASPGGDGTRRWQVRSCELRGPASTGVSESPRCFEISASASGDRVATLAWNTQAHVESWYAIMGMGAVCHTLNPRLTAAQLASMLAQSACRVMFVSADLAPLAQQIIERTSTVANVVIIDGPVSAWRGERYGPAVMSLEEAIIGAARSSRVGRLR